MFAAHMIVSAGAEAVKKKIADKTLAMHQADKNPEGSGFERSGVGAKDGVKACCGHAEAIHAPRPC